MKNRRSTILLLVALAVLLGAAALLYPKLKAEYAPRPVEEAAVPVSGGAEASDGSEASETAAPSPLMAPDFTVTDDAGNALTLSEHFGKPLVLNFWASWCGPCTAELPAFDALAKEYADTVEFLMVNMTDGRRETVDGARQFLEDNGYTFPVYYDTEGSAAYAYAVRSIPLTVLVRADGTVFDARIGSLDEATLGTLLEGLVDGDAIAPRP